MTGHERCTTKMISFKPELPLLVVQEGATIQGKTKIISHEDVPEGRSFVVQVYIILDDKGYYAEEDYF